MGAAETVTPSKSGVQLHPAQSRIFRDLFVKKDVSHAVAVASATRLTEKQHLQAQNKA